MLCVERNIMGHSGQGRHDGGTSWRTSPKQEEGISVMLVLYVSVRVREGEGEGGTQAGLGYMGALNPFYWNGLIMQSLLSPLN